MFCFVDVVVVMVAMIVLVVGSVVVLLGICDSVVPLVSLFLFVFLFLSY